MTQPVESRQRAGEPGTRAPFFVVGAERSGTTLLRLMLGHHPDIAPVDEFDYVTPFIGDGPGYPPTRLYLRRLAEDRAFRARGRRVAPDASVPELARSFLEQARDGRSELLGAVVHHAFHRLPRLWPDARYVHLVRDPRDVAPSTVAMGWAGNVWTGVLRWVEAQDRWQRLRADLPPGRFVEVRFEDLVTDPGRELERVCAFLGVSYDPAMLSIEEDTSYRRPSPRAARRWRERLPPREIGLIEARVAERLVAAGYEPSGLPPVHPSPVERAWLACQDRWARAVFRRRRYGWRLYVADIVSRRVPLAGWRQRVRETVHRVEEAHLR